MEHRGVEYRIIQGIKRGFWKWSIETEIGTKSGTSDSKEAAMAVAKRAIDNALDPQKIEAYSASMISCDLRHEPSIIEYAPTAARFKPRRTHSASLAGQAMNRYRGTQAEFQFSIVAPHTAHSKLLISRASAMCSLRS